MARWSTSARCPSARRSRFAGKRTLRVTFTPLGPDQMRQLAEGLNPDGTWTHELRFDLHPPREDAMIDHGRAARAITSTSWCSRRRWCASAAGGVRPIIRIFIDSGPTPDALFVFPREGVWIQHDGGDPFVADANTVTYYNKGQFYTRQQAERPRRSVRVVRGGARGDCRNAVGARARRDRSARPAVPVHARTERSARATCGSAWCSSTCRASGTPISCSWKRRCCRFWAT